MATGNSFRSKKPVLIQDINITHKFTHSSSMTLTVQLVVPVLLKLFQFKLMEHRSQDIQTRSNIDSGHAPGVTSMFL